MKTSIALVTLVSVLATSSGCATILKGSTNQVRVTSNPEGAKIYVNNEYRGTAPLTLKVPGNKQVYIEATKVGAGAGRREVERTFGVGYLIADAILTLGIGLYIDAISGAWWFNPDEVEVLLDPARKAETP